jgi:hypothetical protein
VIGRGDAAAGAHATAAFQAEKVINHIFAPSPNDKSQAQKRRTFAGCAFYLLLTV